MSPLLLASLILGYFLLLLLISYFTTRTNNNESFFTGDRKSPWYVVAYGMIGASLSGVTFMSVPGSIATKSFSYMQVVLGYLIGYVVIAFVLLPIYYKLNVTSIYTYLQKRFGYWSYKSGAIAFLFSRIIGAAFRLYLVAIVLQNLIIEPLNIGIPFAGTVMITILLIWIYTFKGGIKTIVWTDTLQTTFMLLSVCLTIFFIAKQMDMSVIQLFKKVSDSSYSKVFFFEDFKVSTLHFGKQFMAGIFISIVMTGLDQDMMQKNLTCKNLKDAQKNVIGLGITLIPVNFLFLALGAILYLYAAQTNFIIPEKADLLFATIALDSGLPIIIGIMFIIGLIAAAYSSADSALTALTTSVCYDILEAKADSANIQSIRTRVHVLMSAILVFVIIIFHQLNDDSVIYELFNVAGYTYGPLLGMFSYGIFTKWKVNDLMVPLVCIISPLVCYQLQQHSDVLLGGYQLGFELLIINGGLTFTLLWLSSLVKSTPNNNNSLDSDFPQN